MFIVQRIIIVGYVTLFFTVLNCCKGH